MTFKRFVILFALAVACEVGVFAVSYSDLLLLKQQPAQLLAAPRAEFEAAAVVAVQRSHLTRRHLDTIAITARGFHLAALERRALERMVADHPRDVKARMDLADALRRQGDFERAERLYLDVLSAESGGAR